LKSVKDWINPAILSMQAYHVPPSPGLIKLDAMENPYGWPEELRQEWLQELEKVPVNRYPDPSAAALKDRLRAAMEIPEHVSIMPGNGSDELIQIIAMALAGSDRTFVSPEPGFIMYRLISRTVNTPYHGVQLNPDDFSLDREAMLAAIREHQPALIFIAYPNNPTGNMFDRDVVLEVIKQAPGLVMIDEAYHAFAGASFAGHLHDFENLLVMRTLSKSGLAGLRLGYLLGRQDIMDELEKIRLPYNINALTQKTTEFILAHHEILVEQAASICRHREALYRQLCGLDGIRAWPSAANFILFCTGDRDANQVFEGLKKRGVLIKNLHGNHPLLHNCLRVTAGTEEENAVFIETLQQVMYNC
jgi:histidinol-phosphate aminotransferase